MKAIDLQLFFWRTAGLTDHYVFDLNVKENICVIEAYGNGEELLVQSEFFTLWEVYRYLITTTEEEFKGVDELFYYFEGMWENAIDEEESINTSSKTATVGGHK